MRISDRARYYSQVPAWWAQYEVTVLLFVPTTLILAYYSRMVTLGSTDDQTRMWNISLTKYAFMSGAKFVTNARDRACPS